MEKTEAGATLLMPREAESLGLALSMLEYARDNALPQITIRFVGETERIIETPDELLIEKKPRGRAKGSTVSEETRRNMAAAQKRRYAKNTVEGRKARRATGKAVKRGIAEKQNQPVASS